MMFYIRADANEQTGAGHMMRCLTIAQALTAHTPHPSVLFLCADEDSAALPRKAGFDVRVLGTDYRNMEAELTVLTGFLSGISCGDQSGQNRISNSASTASGAKPTILVDSYHVTDAYLAILRAFARVVLIDDNMERAYPADVILNYNFHADADRYRELYANDGTRFLLGPQYAPVRAQFANRNYKVCEHVEKILILAGGSDPLNAAGTIYRTICGIKNDITVNNDRNNDRVAPVFIIVCGRYSEHAAVLNALAKENDNLVVLHDVDDMATLMCESDLCISACGSTLYELCAVGVPYVCYALADNQMKLAAYLDANGPAPYCGAFHTDREKTLEAVRTQVLRLIGDDAAREKQSLVQRKLVDGRGAERVAAKIGKGCSGGR